MNRLHITLLLYLQFSLSGCAVFDYDETWSNRAKSLTHSCFQTENETSLYQATASDLLKTKPAGIYIIQTHLPYNEWEMGSYGKKWRKIADIPKGTAFRVTKLINQAWGFDGRHWLVNAKFEDSQILNQDFIIPSGNYGASGQIWIQPTSADDLSPVKIKDDFAISCR